jgi:adenylosuccinate lyase
MQAPASAIAPSAEQLCYNARLGNLGSLDGRESPFVGDLALHMSEGALHCARMRVMLENLRQLCDAGMFRALTGAEDELLTEMQAALGTADAERAAHYDHFAPEPLEHDVKACEYVLREKLAATSMADLVEAFYFPLTSEDVNNLAYNCMLSDAISKVWQPAIVELLERLLKLATSSSDLPCLALTHGQPASPTTMGKRFAEMASRLLECLEALRKLVLTGKCSGATGNNNAIVALRPEFHYDEWARHFVESFGFEYQDVANQRNNHLAVAQLFQQLQLVNAVLRDCAENVWSYIKDGYLVQKLVKHEVGSSVMPQKINPWRVEVAFSYPRISNALIADLLPGIVCSRYERDLSDHPWERQYGTIIGHSLLAVRYMHNGLERVAVCPEKIMADLEAHPEVLAEAVQIGGRLLNQPSVYTTVKDQVRAGVPIAEIIEHTIPAGPIKDALSALRVTSYIGDAAEQVEAVNQRYDHFMVSTLHGGGNYAQLLRRDQTIFVYDLDNTLIDTDRYVRDQFERMCRALTALRVSAEANNIDMWNAALREHKITIDAMDAVRAVALITRPGHQEADNDMRIAMCTIVVPSDDRVRDVLSRNLPFESAFDELFPGTGAPMLEFYRAFVEANRSKVQPMPGGLAMVRGIHNVHHCYQAVLTNRSKRAVERLREAGYLEGHFCWIGTAERPKPSPGAFLSLPAWMRRPHHRIVYVGDHAHDARAAIGSPHVAKFYGVGNAEQLRAMRYEISSLPIDRREWALCDSLAAVYMAEF